MYVVHRSGHRRSFYYLLVRSPFAQCNSSSWIRGAGPAPFIGFADKPSPTTKLHHKSRTSSWRRNSSGYLAYRCLCLETQHYYSSSYIAFATSLSTRSVDVRGTSSPKVIVDIKNRSGILLAVQFVCDIRLRVFVTSAHFHPLSLPLGYCSKPFDPQHLRSMAVFSDTAKRLWGLSLFTRCSSPRVLTLRAGWCGTWALLQKLIARSAASCFSLYHN